MSDTEQVTNGKKESKSRSRTRSRSESRGKRSYSRSRSRSRDRRRSRSRSGRRSYTPSRSRSRSRDRRGRRGGGGYRDRSRSPLSSRRRHRGNRDDPEPNRCVGVFGLSLDTRERDVEDYFSKFGKLVHCQLVMDRYSHKSRGFAFIHFEDIEDAIEAKESAPGSEIDGKPIRVDYSVTERAHTPTPGVYLGRPSDRPSRYGGGGGGRYGGGGGYGGGYGGGGGRYGGGGGRYGGGGGGYGGRRRSPSPYSRRRSPSPYRSRRYSRSRSRSYSPRR